MFRTGLWEKYVKIDICSGQGCWKSTEIFIYSQDRGVGKVRKYLYLVRTGVQEKYGSIDICSGQGCRKATEIQKLLIWIQLYNLHLGPDPDPKLFQPGLGCILYFFIPKSETIVHANIQNLKVTLSESIKHFLVKSGLERHKGGFTIHELSNKGGQQTIS